MTLLMGDPKRFQLATERSTGFRTGTKWVEGLETLNRGRVAVALMWIPAILAMIQTIVEIVVLIPFWIVRFRNWQKVMKNVKTRWYAGPFICSSLLFDGLSRTLGAIRASAAGYKALHHIYNWPERHLWPDVNLDQNSWFGERLADWWIHMNNAVAVRNRRVVVVALLRAKFRHFAELFPGETLRILSIACGSAQPLQEALAKEKEYLQARGVRVELRLLDKDTAPLEHSKLLAERFGLAEWVQMQTYQCSYHEARKVCDYGLWQPWLVEMIGLMDYLSAEKGVEAERMICELLCPGGQHITGHILPNSEAFVLRWLIAWPMRYRQPNDLGEIVAAAFPRSNVQLWLVPGGAHVLAEAQKSSLSTLP